MPINRCHTSPDCWSFQTLTLTHGHPVDTGTESPSAQDKRLLDIKNQNKNKIESDTKANTPVDLMEGIHQAREVLEEIKLNKASGMQDAVGHWVPHSDTSFPWSASLVDELFQLGEAIESSKADFVVEGKPKHYCMLLPVISEVNNLGLKPAVTTTSSSSISTAIIADSTLTVDTLALHEEPIQREG